MNGTIYLIMEVDRDYAEPCYYWEDESTSLEDAKVMLENFRYTYPGVEAIIVKRTDEVIDA